MPPDDSLQISGITPGENSGEFSSRYLWGYYLIQYDPDTNTCEVIPVRQASDHWNILFFLESWPCASCLKVTGATPTPWDTINFTVQITHPFENMRFTAFDVRGIAMFDGGIDFPEMDRSAPDASSGTGELINGDGYTSLYASWTTAFSPPALETYIPGKFSTDTIPDASINGFKRFSSPGAENTRNAFYAGDVISRSFDIDMPDGPFIFGYAVDGSWVPPTVNPVIDPMTDFPPEANCPEPYSVAVVVDPIGPGLNLGGGATELIITVFDNEPGTHSMPVLECPDLFTGLMPSALVKHYEDHSVYKAVISNVANPSPVEGDFKCLIRVRDALFGTADDWIDLTAYAVATLRVESTTHGGWARTWGGDSTDTANVVKADKNGNVYVGGYFIGTVDFNPGPGVDVYTSISDSADAYLTRYDNQSKYQSTMVWGGGGGTDALIDIAIDNDGNIYTVGSWESYIDLNPDPDESWPYMAVGNTEGFITKFNLAGDFLWGQVIWGHGEEAAYGVDVDLSNNIYVTGYYENNASFDQDALIHFPSNGDRDAFIAKYATNGDLIWGKTLGSTGNDYGYDVGTSGNEDVAWVGAFSVNDGGGGVDFNPSETLTDLHFSNGSVDAFVIRFNPSGNYEIGISIGDSGIDYCFGAEYSGTSIYACGMFQGEVDFNPGSGFDVHTSNGSFDAWAAKFNNDLILQWAETWGGEFEDTAQGIEAESFGGLYVAGEFKDSVDFDPGSGTDMHDSAGSSDAFLLKLNTSGSFQWVRTIGSTGTDRGTNVDVGEYAFPYMCGTFDGSVDFAPPTSASDVHTSNGSWDGFLVKYLLDGSW